MASLAASTGRVAAAAAAGDLQDEQRLAQAVRAGNLKALADLLAGDAAGLNVNSLLRGQVLIPLPLL
jgi:hypothetical protein